jgi:hypothetical protein
MINHILMPIRPTETAPQVSLLNRLRVVLVLLSINWQSNPIPTQMETWFDRNDPDGKLRKYFGFIRTQGDEPDRPTRFWIYAIISSFALVLVIVIAQLLRLYFS